MTDEEKAKLYDLALSVLIFRDSKFASALTRAVLDICKPPEVEKVELLDVVRKPKGE